MADPSEVHRRFALSDIPARYRDLRLDQIVPRDEAQEFCLRIVEDWYEARTAHISKIAEDGSLERVGDGVGLLLAGDTGTGKTMLACALLNGILDRKGLVWFTTLQRLNDMYFSQADLREAWSKFDDEGAYLEWTDNDQWLSQVQDELPLLCLDDVGREFASRRSDWTAAKFESLLRHRFDRGLPTIVTSNLLGLDDWDKRFKRDSLSSFIREAFEIVPMQTEDQR